MTQRRITSLLTHDDSRERKNDWLTTGGGARLIEAFERDRTALQEAAERDIEKAIAEGAAALPALEQEETAAREAVAEAVAALAAGQVRQARAREATDAATVAARSAQARRRRQLQEELALRRLALEKAMDEGWREQRRALRDAAANAA